MTFLSLRHKKNHRNEKNTDQTFQDGSALGIRSSPGTLFSILIRRRSAQLRILMTAKKVPRSQDREFGTELRDKVVQSGYRLRSVLFFLHTDFWKNKTYIWILKNLLMCTEIETTINYKSLKIVNKSLCGAKLVQNFRLRRAKIDL